MKSTNFTYLKFLLAALAMVSVFFHSCSTSKDKFANRAYHKTTAYFNVVFNGNNSLAKAEEILVDQYQDDFREILPVAPFEVGLRGVGAAGYLTKAVEKASKSIQKHSMNILGVERNSEMDKAYLLLGKARFYQTKYLPALEAFNYVKLNFKVGKEFYEAQLWAIRAEIELENYAQASGDLDLLIANPNFPKKYKGLVFAYYAELLIRNSDYEGAVLKLTTAIGLEKNRALRTRYQYILGQVYQIQGNYSKADQLFAEVYENGVPYEFRFYSRLAIASNFNPLENTSDDYFKFLDNMLKDEKNFKKLDEIYYQKASIYYKLKEYDSARVNLNLALIKAANKRYSKGLSYEMLGDLNFEISDYKSCAAYYDSTLQSMNNSYKNFKLIKRKRKQLDNVIAYIEKAELSDSVLILMSLTPEQREMRIYNHIERQKLKDQEIKLSAIDQANTVQAEKTVNQAQGSRFYFYNEAALTFGRNEFKKKWGNRGLRDNWRNNSQSQISVVQSGQDQGSVNSESNVKVGIEPETEQNPLYQISYYLDRLPKDSAQIAELRFDRDYSYYALGLIYNEQFAKYELSSKTLDRLLEYEPSEDIKLPAYYYQYKNYKSLGYAKSRLHYENLILNNYPDSRYAAIIRNPELQNSQDKEKVYLMYERMLSLFKNQKYREVIACADSIVYAFPDDLVLPKVELAKAKSIGSIGTRESYKQALDYVIYNFPNDEVSLQAKQLLDDLKATSNLKVDISNRDNPRIVILCSKNENFDKLEKVLEYPIWQKRLKTSRSQFSMDQDVFVVYGFKNWDQAVKFENEFMGSKTLKQNLKFPHRLVVISSDNFYISYKLKTI